MLNSRRVALIMRRHVQESSRRVSTAYELGQLGNATQEIASNPVGPTRLKSLRDDANYQQTRRSEVNYHYLAKPWEERP